MSSPLFTHPILSPENLQTIREQPSPLPSPLKQEQQQLLQPIIEATDSAEPSSKCPSATADLTHTSPPISNTLLQDYSENIDPLQSSDPTLSRCKSHEQNTGAPPSSTTTHLETLSLSPGFPSSPMGPTRSFLQHRKNARSIDSIPRQTILKALASKGNGSLSCHIPPPASLASLLALTNSETDNSSSRKLSVALPSSNLSNERTPSTARFPLTSPCFYHQRFDDAVNIDKVLEEIAADEWMSHSRLMQTATGVREVSKQLQRRPIKLAVKNVMIVTKARDNRLVYLTRELSEWLLSTPRYGSDLGVNVYVDHKLQHSKRFDAPGLLAKEPRFEHMLKYWTPDLCWSSPETFDLVLTLGGDGTVLYTSWLFQRVVPPVLSFALGSLGFLTNFEFEKYKEHLNQIMGDVGMRVNLRMRFTCTVYRADRRPGHLPGAVVEGEQFEVVNELVIDRGPSPYVSNLELYGDNELLTVVQADGCIFSTPTGSTAYSLSAGGSLVHPSIPGILLTPICPHTLSFRPMVLSDALLLRIAVPNASRSTAYCSFDGKGRIELRQGDYVTVEASQYPFPTVVAGSGEWFESVRRALRWNVRGAVQKAWNDPTDGDLNTAGDEDEEEQWDIDPDSDTPFGAGTDSGLGPSEDGESPGSSSPLRRKLSLLNM
ncbi:NAD kinase associated with ferric reductase [Histoplasma capsulatum G186AR]|uniref:NAD kinase associated with ferric reductase n=1 Tax=Ajellomyces capsulatus TaxID=5037 RepID=A0A8H7ZAR3_AJECA|nr:NAD kinase associated with ferric reductase [Histoplasma capsulatum]QSS69933.1 NAD kinase associated with ferric reductase [Histoplasma capsulatum G186AR]